MVNIKPAYEEIHCSPTVMLAQNVQNINNRREKNKEKNANDKPTVFNELSLKWNTLIIFGCVQHIVIYVYVTINHIKVSLANNKQQRKRRWLEGTAAIASTE